ncbi:MAG: flagellar biosynthesis anti-sigma factor FlgM [Bacilli bacterium]
MRINEPNRVGALGAYQKLNGNLKNKDTNKAGNRRDEVEISSEALKMQALSDNDRNNRVAELKERYESGTYSADPKAVAEKLLNHWK